MSDRDPVRVMIVDDHPLMRYGLAVFVRNAPDMDLVAEASSGLEAVRLCDECVPDVVLMDLKMPGLDGTAATRAIRRRHPQVQVVALTSYSEEELIHEAIQAGAIGYLLKDVSPAELREAVWAAKARQPSLSLTAAKALARETLRPAQKLWPSEPDP